MSKRLLAVVAILLGAAIHTDWHFARREHHRLSLGWTQHWLFGVVVFAALAWFVRRRWAAHTWPASALVIGGGVLIGMGLEPLGEVIGYGSTFDQLQMPLRWAAFAEFGVAGLLAYVGVMALLAGRNGRN